jgi:hypothetical protein
MMLRPAVRSFGKLARPLLGCGLLFVTLLGAEPLHAQAAPQPPSDFQNRLEQLARELAIEPRLKRFSPEKRLAIVEFVFGNMLFAAGHELGHGVIREFELPVLGREEDAADSFAIFAALQVGTEFSHRVLVEAVKGWFLSDKRDKKLGEKFAYYDEHGMNLQRAYQIVCFVFGSDPAKYKELAQESMLPEERQESCKAEYGEAAWAWNTVLKSHKREAEQQKPKIDVIYGDAQGRLETFARSFRSTRFLETLVERVVDNFAWPRPLVIEMRTCGEAGSQWKAAKLTLCYELALEFSQLYRDFGDDPKITKIKTKADRKR